MPLRESSDFMAGANERDRAGFSLFPGKKPLSRKTIFIGAAIFVAVVVGLVILCLLHKPTP